MRGWMMLPAPMEDYLWDDFLQLDVYKTVASRALGYAGTTYAPLVIIYPYIA